MAHQKQKGSFRLWFLNLQGKRPAILGYKYWENQRGNAMLSSFLRLLVCSVALCENPTVSQVNARTRVGMANLVSSPYPPVPQCWMYYMYITSTRKKGLETMTRCLCASEMQSNMKLHDTRQHGIHISDDLTPYPNTSCLTHYKTAWGRCYMYIK